MKKIHKIALSGGACSGKTTILPLLKKHYSTNDTDVIICEESARKLLLSGRQRDDMTEFEKNVAELQLKSEQDAYEKACLSDAENVIIFFDRTITDCFAYVDDEETFSDLIGLSRIISWQRYDAVLFLETADISDYIKDNIRTEDYSDTIKTQRRALNAYIGHPHLRYIPSSDNIEDKFISVCSQVDCILSSLEIEKKYLIEYPDIQRIKDYPHFKAEISQTYLLSALGSHRVRKRGANGIYSYFETLKFRVTGSIAKEIENTIDSQTYEELLKSADPNRKTITKDRYCILYKNQYLELDVFPFWDDKALLEIELKSENEVVELPDFIKVIKDVSDMPEYKNSNIARTI